MVSSVSDHTGVHSTVAVLVEPLGDMVERAGWRSFHVAAPAYWASLQSMQSLGWMASSPSSW